MGNPNWQIDASSGNIKSPTGAVVQDGPIRVFADLPALRGFSGAPDALFARTLFHHTIGDGFGKEWLWLSGAAPGTYVDDAMCFIVPTGGNGSAAWVVTRGLVYTPAISQDSFLAIRTPKEWGWASFVDSPGTFPQGSSSGIINFDTGASPALNSTTALKGANFVTNGAVVPNGTTGVAGNITVSCGAGIIYLESRRTGAAIHFGINFFV